MPRIFCSVRSTPAPIFVLSRPITSLAPPPPGPARVTLPPPLACSRSTSTSPTPHTSNSVLYANTPGTKTATFNIGRTLAGVSTATAITIGNSGTDSAKLLVGTDSSSVTGSASSPLAGGATTLLTVGTSGSVAAGSDVNQHVIIHNNSNINDSTDVSVNVTAHVVGVRFIDDTDLHSTPPLPTASTSVKSSSAPPSAQAHPRHQCDQ